MKKLIYFSSAFYVCITLTLSQAWAQLKKPKFPVITQVNKPWARWWWEGSAVDTKNLTWIMEEYKKVGLGGLEITPIYGVKGYEKQFVNFTSPKWMDMLTHTLKEGSRLGLGIDMAQASGWPFGGPWVTDADASKYITYKTYALKSGESLTEKVEFMQVPLTRIVGEKIDISQLTDPITKNPNLQLHAFDQVRFQKPLPLQVLMAYSDKGEILDITKMVDALGKLNWTAPSGNWTLFAAFEGWHGKMVERAGPGGEGYAIDHFSKEATTRYLQHFDKAFKGYNIKPIRAFFNDSYEVDDANGEANWTPRFFEEFRLRRGYDLTAKLPALFGKDTEDNNIRILSDYRETISELLLENYTKTWHAWAKGKGALIRNQAHGSPANILDLYAATDIPEAEGTELIRIKFASSAAHVTGKNLSSSESATWNNEHFISKLSDVKMDMDRFLLSGINHTFYHGANYTPKEAPWPGWLFYAATHFTPNNPFWADFSALNKYVAHSQSFLQQGKPNNDVLLYFPVFDAYGTPGKSMLQHFDGLGTQFKGTAVEEGAELMEKMGYSFDFISDAQLQSTAALNKFIQTGGVAYKTIILPGAKYVPLATLQKIIALVKAGVQVIIYKDLPADVPGFGTLDTRRGEFRKILAGLNFIQTGTPGIKKAIVGKGSFIMSDDLDKALSFAGINRETMVDKNLKTVSRKLSNGYNYFITNWGEKAVDGWVPVAVNAASIAIFNPMTEKTGYASILRAGANKTEVYLQIAAGETLILQTSNSAIKGAAYEYVVPSGDTQVLSGDWTITFSQGGPTLPAAINTSTLKSWTEMGSNELENFSGTAKYTLSFAKPAGVSDGWMLDLGNVQESAAVKLNGKYMGTIIGPLYQLEIPAANLKNTNVLEISVSNTMANRITYMDKNGLQWKIFYNTNIPARLGPNRGMDGMFSAAKWQPRPSGLIGPVILTGVKYIAPFARK